MSVADPLLQMSFLGEAIEDGPVAVFVFDDLGRYVAVNRYACELLGYTREELLELRIGALTVSADDRAGYRHALSARDAVGRTLVRRKDGSVLALCYRAAETKVAELSFFVGVAWPDPSQPAA